ncbi:hypothetical protein HPP92_009049 [Vanilla planifolia]|uniref:Uncharacterized protein n=1 Tax=Vanilla planifolia TaxID=51239 RepID=A0A835V4C1_VANPL|nr:hypothetical protein HPP92_009049 [Vanilla planifolia]
MASVSKSNDLNGQKDLIVDPVTRNYFPTIYFNEFWLLKDKLIALNDSVTELPLNLEVGPIGLNKWQFFLQIEQSFQIHRSYGSMVEGEADELKRVFLEGNPYLLVVTMIVSVLHSLFDFLAFKNDVVFLIYLYQRWIYPVDKTRVNEFGFGGEDQQPLVANSSPAIADTDSSSENSKKIN